MQTLLSDEHDVATVAESLSDAVALAVTDPAVVDKIQSSYALISVRVSYWRGQPKVKNARVTVEGKEVARNTTSDPRWCLLPETWKKRFSALEQQVQAAVAHYAIPAHMYEDDETSSDAGKLTGVHLVPASRLEEFFGRLSALQALMAQAADEFCTPANREQVLAELKAQDPDPAVFAAKIDKVPSAEQMRARFGIRKAALPTCLPASATADPDSFYAKIAADSTRSQAAQNLETAIRAPRTRLARAAGNLLGQLAENSDYGPVAKSGRTVRGESLAAFLRELKAFDNFRELASDPDLDDACDQALGRLLGSGDAALLAGGKGSGDSLTAKYLNREDEPALELAQVLSALVRAADSEVGMIEALRKFQGGGI